MKKYWVMLIAVSLFQCQKTSLDVRPFPRMETSRVEVATGTATFYGKYLLAGHSPITDHGFVWAKDYPDLNSAGKVSLGVLAAPGDFNATVTTPLDQGVYYAVRAYAVTTDYVVYGETLSFTAK
jgi:hypothetical protein